MRKTVYTLFATAVAAMTLTGCDRKQPSETSDQGQPQQSIRTNQPDLKPFAKLQTSGGATADVFELPSPRNPNDRIIIVTGGDVRYDANVAIATIAAGKTNVSAPQETLKPFASIVSGGGSTEEIFELTPPSNQDARCRIVTGGDVRYDTRVAITCSL